MSNNKKRGDFTGLAQNYSKYRPSYSESVMQCLIALLDKQLHEVDFIDVGAGTGIWTRMIARLGVNTAVAIEPNDDMRNFGISDSQATAIRWISGSAENIPLIDNSADFLTMASSFHWADFSLSTKEFARVLRSGGRFAALWNPRLLERNPLLLEIENKLYEMVPHLKRVSSGRSGITENLTDMLNTNPYFDDVVYLSAEHSLKQSIEDYLGVWWSVNDIRAQAGEVIFNKFMHYVAERITGLPYIDVTYQTRAWSARRI